MSCQIRSIANLTNISNIREVLFTDLTARPDHIPLNELPLQECCISLSSAGDVLAMAYNTKMIILVSRWDSQESDEVKNKFHMIWYGELAKGPNEWITSVICLPLLSLGKAGSGANPDWTCVVVGFNTGHVRFYTETGGLLLTEQLHGKPVIGIKCQSFAGPKYTGDVGSVEELYIIYSTAVCVLQGFPLFSTLRACRNHLARVQANCEDLPPMTNLSYKKWGYRSQDIVNDAEVIGSTSVDSFDHLVTASICGGYNAAYRSSAPQHNLVVATGKRPFIGFHYALEGGNVPVLSDVAIAMASKLASAIGTAVPWFRGSGKQQSAVESAKTGAQEPAEPMTCRFGLSDITREGYSIVSTPNKALSVLSDALGRVLLIETRRGIAIRMWKGYRDAQCGWIEAEEERQSGLPRAIRSKQTSHPRTALFLVIYAPKKGIIDIWSIQHGPKITTFTASKNGRLLYINYGLLGCNDNAHLSRNKPQYSCVFMDPIGGLKEISVPFHFALNSTNGKRARDIHLLKKLKTFLREEDFDEEGLILEIRKTCFEITTNEMRVQIVEMLMINRSITPAALSAAVWCFSEKLQEYDEDQLEPAGKTLRSLCAQLQRVIEFYVYVNDQFDLPPDYDSMDLDSELTSKSLASILLTSEREVHRTLKLFTTINSIGGGNPRTDNKVKFKDDGNLLSDFLSCFEFGTSSVRVKLRVKDITFEKKFRVSRLMYQGSMCSSGIIDAWKEVAGKSQIEPFVLMEFALIYWLGKQNHVSLSAELKRLTQVLSAVCSIPAIEEICVGYNQLSTWWKDVRSILTEATEPFSALTAALACRAVLMTLENCQEKFSCSKREMNVDSEEEETNGSRRGKGDGIEGEEKDKEEKETRRKSEEESIGLTNEWENVSKDSCQFSLLIGSLEDVTVLHAIVSQPPPTDSTTRFFALPFVNWEISLSSILSRGKGSVSEIVAKWLSSSGLDPVELVDTTDVEFDQVGSTSEARKSEGSLEEACDVGVEANADHSNLLSLSVEVGSEAKSDLSARNCILERVTLLKRHFPYSLTSSVLLANLCWEYAMSWNKDVTELKALDAALLVLRQIPMKRTRQGVCCLLWSVHIKKRLEAVAKLMNKRGKLPKERLCMQDVGLSDIQLTIFLQHCVTFLEIFLDSEILDSEQDLSIRSEELWEGYRAGPQPFAALAISQVPAWYDLILLHIQVASVLYMMAQFNIKMQKPLNTLFESVVQPYFFQNIADKIILTWYRDDNRDKLRTEFLCRVITASMDYIHRETTDGKTLNSSQAIQWMSRCQTLASTWKINNDELRIHQVCQLYVNGFDRLAEEVIAAVNDVEGLASQLLPIAGRRMMSYLSRSPDLLGEVARISPALTKYLESLNVPQVVCASSSNDDTVELVRRVSRYLPESNPDYHVAQLLLDATFIYECDA